MHELHLTFQRSRSLAQPTLNVPGALTLACPWAVILSFISRVFAFLFFFFLPRAGDTDGCFVDTISNKHWQHRMLHSLRCLPSWLSAWRGAVAAAAQHHESITLHVTSPGKDQQPTLEVWFLLNTYLFSIIIRSKNSKSNHRKLETIYLSTSKVLSLFEEKNEIGFCFHCL